MLNEAAAAPLPGIVFLLDVDNTLLDNDRFGVDLGDHLEKTLGASERARYWQIFAERREQLGWADYLGSLQVLRAGLDGVRALLLVSEFMLEYPYADVLFPQALNAIAHLATLGTAVVLSDGDVVFQPRKIRHSGVWNAVAGRVLIYVHKEKVLDDVQRRYPAAHYVMVDDKANLLAAMKTVMGAKLTTIFVRQGHYAHDVQSSVGVPAPDRTIECIGDLTHLNLSDFQVTT